MTGSEPVALEANALRVSFRDGEDAVHPVRGIDLQLRRGETLGIVGESGSGKSLTALALMGLLPPSSRLSGTVTIGGELVSNLSEDQWNEVRGKRIAMIFQNPMSSLNPVLTIGEQLTETIRRHRKISHADAKRIAISLLLRMKLPNAPAQFESFPHELSGGMRQRVMIAIAIANHPDVLIADEPTTALDASVQREILDLLEEIQTETGMAIVLITHDLGLVSHYADRVVVMYAGRLVEERPGKDLFLSASHPYTKALMGARPRRRPRVGARPKLTDIPGQVPLPADVALQGCSFAPRCASVLDVCKTLEPPMRAFGADCRIACHLQTAGIAP